MKTVPCGADQEALAQARNCVDLLADMDFERAGIEFGYALAFGRPASDCIRGAIAAYQSPRLFPNERDFCVSDWRAATGGNPAPRSRVTWYKSNTTGLVGVIEFDLPLNGRWSDLLAEFVLFQDPDESGNCILSLEEISSPIASERSVA